MITVVIKYVRLGNYLVEIPLHCTVLYHMHYHYFIQILFEPNMVREFGDIAIENGSPMKSDILLDSSKEYLFTSTKNKVSDYNILGIQVVHNAISCNGISKKSIRNVPNV